MELKGLVTCALLLLFCGGSNVSSSEEARRKSLQSDGAEQSDVADGEAERDAKESTRNSLRLLIRDPLQELEGRTHVSGSASTTTNTDDDRNSFSSSSKATAPPGGTENNGKLRHVFANLNNLGNLGIDLSHVSHDLDELYLEMTHGLSRVGRVFANLNNLGQHLPRVGHVFANMNNLDEHLYLADLADLDDLDEHLDEHLDKHLDEHLDEHLCKKVRSNSKSSEERERFANFMPTVVPVAVCVSLLSVCLALIHVKRKRRTDKRGSADKA